METTILNFSGSYIKYMVQLFAILSVKRPTSRPFTFFFAAVSHELFEDKKNKTRETFKNAIEIFNGRDHRRRGAVEFIQAALKNMKQFGVHKYDLYFPF